MTSTLFQELIADSQLRKAIEAQGYDEPTPVQLKAIPPIIAGKSLLVSSKTGSGKTAAFLLPSLQKILSEAPVNPLSTRILILTPTRELARQIVKSAEQLLRFTSIKVAMICGGEELKYQKAVLRKNPEVIVATPGRLAEHIAHKATDFSGLTFLILDEADRMLEMGLNEDVLVIAGQCSSERQTLLFSATMEQKGLRHLIKEVMLGETEQIHIEELANKITQQIVLADDVKHKEKLLIALLTQTVFEKVVVFTNTKIKAAELDGLLRYNKYRVSALHGDMAQDQRKISLDFFRQGKTQVLVATDVAARGLDIVGVDLVVNFDMPHSGDEYVHRIGRTGRADNEGKAISFVSAKDWNLARSIERYVNVEFEEILFAGVVAKYKGPQKIKSSGKAAGVKNKTPTLDKKLSSTKEPKVKVRDRVKKNVGKRRTPSAPMPAVDLGDGFSTFKMKPQSDLISK
jgi:ATP-dependent RNA helicase SrmB